MAPQTGIIHIVPPEALVQPGVRGEAKMAAVLSVHPAHHVVRDLWPSSGHSAAQDKSFCLPASLVAARLKFWQVESEWELCGCPWHAALQGGRALPPPFPWSRMQTWQ